MKVCLCVAALVGCLGIAVSSNAAIVLGVDLNGGGGSTTTAAGWSGWNPGAGTNASTTIGSYGVNIFTPVTGYSFDGRNRSAPSTNLGNGHIPSGLGLMYKDLTFVAAGGNQGRAVLGVTVSGLTPNTTYEVTAYSFDNSGSGGQTNFTTTPPLVNQLGNPTGYDFNNFPAHESVIWTSPFDEFGTGANVPPAGATFPMTTNASGVGSFYGWGGDGVNGNAIASSSTYLNGFSISTVGVPEPATFVMLALAGVSFIGFRRRS